MEICNIKGGLVWSMALGIPMMVRCYSLQVQEEIDFILARHQNSCFMRL